MARLTGTQLGRYHIGELLGHGGFAAVYKARDEGLDTDVAVKVLADIHSFDPEARERFLSEGRLLRRVRHPSIVQVHDIGETFDGQPYLVLQLGRRGSLADRVPDVAPPDPYLKAAPHRGALPADTDGRPPAAPRVSVADLRLVADTLTGALGTLHNSGIVHRDITPANLFITTKEETDRAGGDGPETGRVFADDEQLLIGDLGLAKDLSQGSGLTAGAGTRRYSAPEQQHAVATVTAAADIFSASRVMTELATLSPRSSEITEAMTVGLDDDPANRPATMQEWRDLLDPFLAPDDEGIGRVGDGGGQDGTVASSLRGGEQGVEPMEAKTPSTATPTESVPTDRRRHRWLVVGLAAVATLFVAGLGFVLSGSDGDGESEEPQGPTDVATAIASAREALDGNGRPVYDGSETAPGWSDQSWGEFGEETFSIETGEAQLSRSAAVSIAGTNSDSEWIDVAASDWIVFVVSDLTPALEPTSAFRIRATSGGGGLPTECPLSGTDFARTDVESGETLITVPASLVLPDGGPISRLSVMSSENFTELRFRMLLAGVIPESVNPPASQACG